MLYKAIIAFAGLIISQASAGSTAYKSSKSESVSAIFQFSQGAWVENIAVRPDGQLLVTRLDVPELYLIDPSHQSATLVHSFADANALLGIIEVAPDVFAVVAGVVSISTASVTPGSFAIWKVNMRSSRAAISRIARVAEADFLNGITLLDAKTHTVLIADSVKSVIWRLNTRTGLYSVALSDTTMQPAPDAPIRAGVNGVKVRNGFVYYTSTTKGLLCRVQVDATGSAVGAFETVATWPIVDDFALRNDGTAYIAGFATNAVVKVTPAGAVSVIAGNRSSTVVAGATAAQFGRGRWDSSTLYVTTSGAQLAPVNGIFTEGGKIVALDLTRL